VRLLARARSPAGDQAELDLDLPPAQPDLPTPLAGAVCLRVASGPGDALSVTAVGLCDTAVAIGLVAAPAAEAAAIRSGGERRVAFRAGGELQALVTWVTAGCRVESTVGADLAAIWQCFSLRAGQVRRVMFAVAVHGS
jgi:hypothetical protein